MLTNILAQLTMINKRLELQGEDIARHDQLLDDTNGSVETTTPLPKAAKNGDASGMTGSIGDGSGDNGECFVHLHTLHHHDF
jgi:hypothetical protein